VWRRMVLKGEEGRGGVQELAGVAGLKGPKGI
jgi:hypothetical protein